MDLNFNSCKILIVGDVMLDKYYFGKVERISPEAPVPIVNIVNEESRLGGASNVANNITSLGGQATLCGAIGHDFFGKEIERMARQKKIKTGFVKTEQPTITKARIIGGKTTDCPYRLRATVGTFRKSKRRSPNPSCLSSPRTPYPHHLGLRERHDHGRTMHVLDKDGQITWCPCYRRS